MLKIELEKNYTFWPSIRYYIPERKKKVTFTKQNHLFQGIRDGSLLHSKQRKVVKKTEIAHWLNSPNWPENV